jgi:hypothetical protein
MVGRSHSIQQQSVPELVAVLLDACRPDARSVGVWQAFDFTAVSIQSARFLGVPCWPTVACA